MILCNYPCLCFVCFVLGEARVRLTLAPSFTRLLFYTSRLVRSVEHHHRRPSRFFDIACLLCEFFFFSSLFVAHTLTSASPSLRNARYIHSDSCARAHTHTYIQHKNNNDGDKQENGTTTTYPAVARASGAVQRRCSIPQRDHVQRRCNG